MLQALSLVLGTLSHGWDREGSWPGELANHERRLALNTEYKIKGILGVIQVQWWEV